MRPLRHLGNVVVLATITAWATTIALGACSSDAPATTNEDAGRRFPGNTESSGGPGGTSGTLDPVPVTPTADAAVEAGPPALGSNPKKISCAAAECASPGSRCCWPENDAGAGVCATNEEGCDGANTLEVTCDEKADCPGAEDRCCLGFGTTGCNPEGCYEGPQLCKTNAECGPGETCGERSCTRGGDGYPEFTIRLKVCGKPEGCL